MGSDSHPEWSQAGREAARRFMMRALINVLAEQSGNPFQFRNALRAEMGALLGSAVTGPVTGDAAAFKRGVALETESLLSPPIPKE